MLKKVIVFLSLFVMLLCGKDSINGKDSISTKDSINLSQDSIESNNEKSQNFIESISDKDLDSMDAASLSELIASQFYTLNFDSKNPHKKINHAKGFCSSGEFAPRKNITQDFDIPMLKEKNIPALVRFSLSGGDLNASDKSKIRSMALKLTGTESWDIVMTNAEINFINKPQDLSRFLAIKIDEKQGKISATEAANRIKNIESIARFQSYEKRVPLTSSYSQASFHSAHAFYFRNKKGEFVAARLKFVPLNSKDSKGISQGEFDKLSNDFLESNFKNELKKGEISFKFMLVLASINDDINDINALWSGLHKEIEVGILRIKKYEGKGCNGDVFMPNILPEGVGEPSDPVFLVRNLVYALTFARRQ
ncbi:catalase [Helicobacter saguini]|nr:catalase [Helicobacter saguini]